MQRAAALGFFDGVHRGHRRILRTAAELAAARGWTGAAVTFETHPRALILGRAPEMITTPEQRAALMRAQGIHEVVFLPFDQQTADTPPEEFAAMLRERWQIGAVVCGDNFRFGRNAAGDPDLLRRCGMETVVCPPVMYAGQAVSSTRIRQAVHEGSVVRASEMLGRPFSVCGEVRGGYQLGRRLGYPTVNLRPQEGMLLPRQGVYAARVTTDSGVYAAVTDVGTRPTFSDAGIVSIESYLLDFSGDLYGRQVTVELLKYLRRERTFADGDALRAQIAKDIEQARGVCERKWRA